MKELKNILNMDSFLNEGQKFGMSVLKKQGIKLGKYLSSLHDLDKGEKYCIADPGDNEWRGDYEYAGVEKNKHTFDMLGPDGEPEDSLEFTKFEIDDLIADKGIAFQS